MLATRETDYRIVYMKEKDFEERVNDIYRAQQTHKRAPYFVNILEELVDIEAALFITHNEDFFSDLGESGIDELYKKVESGDFEAIQFVFERMNRSFIEQFAKDLFLYLVSHQFVFLEQDLYDRNDWVIHNSVLQEIW